MNRDIVKECIAKDIDYIKMCKKKYVKNIRGGVAEISLVEKLKIYIKNMRNILDNNRFEIPHLGVLCTTYCNLNCKNCADCIPIRKNKHYDVVYAIRDLRKILKEIDKIHEVLLIGGEIFMYPYLERLLKFCIKSNKINRIALTTNGSIIPSENILSLLKHNKVYVRVSDYKVIGEKQKRFMDLLEKKNITYVFLENMKWYDIGNLRYRNKNKEQLEKLFKVCSMKDCIGLSNGKIFYCSRHMTNYELKIGDYRKDYIDIRTSDNIINDYKIFYKKNYIDACNYCDGLHPHSKRVPVAIQEK